jgi:quercetin dioxygenase-like cupin family protein
MAQSEFFILGKTHPTEKVDEGITRQVLGFNDELMTVKVSFCDGAIGYIHQHSQSQVTYVESGEFEVQIGSEVKTLKPGDCFFVPPNIEHGAVCKKSGVLIDTFNPHREDFLAK